jgi:hypothetical protein
MSQCSSSTSIIIKIILKNKRWDLEGGHWGVCPSRGLYYSFLSLFCLLARGTTINLFDQNLSTDTQIDRTEYRSQE